MVPSPSISADYNSHVLSTPCSPFIHGTPSSLIHGIALGSGGGSVRAAGGPHVQSCCLGRGNRTCPSKPRNGMEEANPPPHFISRSHSENTVILRAGFFLAEGPGCLGGWVVPGPAGPRNFFETFYIGVGKILGLGGSKYRPPGGGGGVVGGPGRPGPKSARVGPPGSVKRSLSESTHA